MFLVKNIYRQPGIYLDKIVVKSYILKIIRMSMLTMKILNVLYEQMKKSPDGCEQFKNGYS